jgi:alpha-glucosidase
MRPATKYGLLTTVDRIRWKNSGGTTNPLDERARSSQSALSCFYVDHGVCLVAPISTRVKSSACFEVLDIPEDQIQDPQYLRNHKVDKGRDGCRVPLPWTNGGPSFGFGTGSAHLPQPNWFAAKSVEALSGVADITT